MDETRESEAAPTKNHTTVERRSERELVVTRTVNGPARLVFEACTKSGSIQEVVGAKIV